MVFAVVVPAIALSGAAFVGLVYGWRWALGERRVQGSVVMLAAVPASITAFGLMVFGHSPS
ncbi:hypothetical protein [Spirillospora sp. NPDC048819]|uniref:hypothetical protein n=1 Tax=Spirillospora sp. NPDC048819 TaxID=3155268 RepID=UPI0033C200E3